MKKIILIILAFVLAACLGSSELSRNQMKWKNANITHYRFKFRFSDFWGSTAGPAIIEVQNGKVISKTFKDGSPITEQDEGFEGYTFNITMEYLFSEIRSSSGQADMVTVEYDPTYGYPSYIYIDYSLNSADEERGWTIESFEVLPPIPNPQNHFVPNSQPPLVPNFQAHLATYLILSTAFLLGGIVIIYWLHNQYHLNIVVEPTSPPQRPPLISVCIPARNEERNIRACVEAVLAQDYPNLEIIVLDDRSTDATPEILRQIKMESAGLRANRKQRAVSLHIVNGSDLPAGWAGKPHALHQASTVARGKWLCFIDADTFISPQALSSCLTKAVETGADMFTIMTFQVLGSFWEKTVMPLVMTALSVGFSSRKVNDPKTKDAIANGQFILIKRSVYDAIGGHKSVKCSIVEDKAISERVKWSGYRLIVADGMKVARTRMYTSLPEMWEGWTKNIYLGLRDRTGLMVLGVFGAFLAVMASLFLPLWPLLGLSWFLNGGGWMALAVIGEAFALWGYLLIARARVSENMQLAKRYALTTPLGAGVFAAMMFASAWKVLTRRGVTWKGRTYRVKMKRSGSKGGTGSRDGNKLK